MPHQPPDPGNCFSSPCGLHRMRTLREGLGDTRRIAMSEMADKGSALGAPAIVGVDIDYETVGSNGSMLMATAAGTAVRLE